MYVTSIPRVPIGCHIICQVVMSWLDSDSPLTFSKLIYLTELIKINRLIVESYVKVECLDYSHWFYTT